MSLFAWWLYLKIHQALHLKFINLAVNFICEFN